MCWRPLARNKYGLARLKAQATRLDAEAVFVPSLAHFDGEELPGSLVRQLDVITVHPEETYSRVQGHHPMTHAAVTAALSEFFG
ncbi:hypothetical protein [Nocardia sp. NPDC051981]|uniref:hypothetical protein n=1 Tax=Nocardia sp. NPDC051981 TaxID=3155417 RepID=UPI00343763C6